MTEPAEPPVARVTGGSTGVGLETVRRLVTAGFRVYRGARSSERGQPAADEAGAQFDVTPEESVIRAAATVELADGHLDVLVIAAQHLDQRRHPGMTATHLSGD